MTFAFETPSRQSLEAFIEDGKTLLDIEAALDALQALVAAAPTRVKSEIANVVPTVAVTFQTVSTLPLAKADLKQGTWIAVYFSGRFSLLAANTIRIAVRDRSPAIIAGMVAAAAIGPADVVNGNFNGVIRFQIRDVTIDATTAVMGGGGVAMANSNGLMRAIGADNSATSATTNADFNADGDISLDVLFGATGAGNAITFSNVYWEILY